jgi:hypothetical protein
VYWVQEQGYLENSSEGDADWLACIFSLDPETMGKFFIVRSFLFRSRSYAQNLSPFSPSSLS